MLPELENKNINVENLAERALEDEKVITELLEAISSKNDTIRFNSHKVLLHICKEHPETIYPKWDYLQSLLNSDNNYHKYIAINLISYLTRIDTEKKFEKIFDNFYSIIDGKGTITVALLVGNSGIIALAKPELQSKITQRLLNIDKTHRGKQIELIKGFAVEAFGEYFEEAENKKEIMEFVKKQLNSESPKTRKNAENFLKKWE